jgi:glycosyltransferase involved in cell wall biosynthesis
MPIQSVEVPQASPAPESLAVISVIVTPGHQGATHERALSSIGTPAIPIETLPLRVHYDADLRGGGIAHARNRALENCRGEFVVFLRGDERLTPGALELGAATLESHPEAAFVFGRCLRTDREGTPYSTDGTPRITRDHYRGLLRRNYIGTIAAAMFRRSVLQRFGGFRDLHPEVSAYELYLRMSRHHPVLDHGQVVAVRADDARMRSRDAAVMLADTLEVLRAQRAFLEGDNASLLAYAEGWKMWQEQFEPLIANEIRAAVDHRNWSSAAFNGATLLRYHPRGVWHHTRRLLRLPLRGSRRAMPAS